MPLSIGGVRGLDQRLTDVVCGKGPDEGQYKANQILLTMPVTSKNYRGEVWVEDEIPMLGQQHLNLKRSGMQPYAVMADKDPSYISYECEERSLLGQVPWDLAKRSEFPVDLLDHKAGALRRALIIEYEKAIADLLFTAGNWDAANTSTLAALSGGSGNKFGTAGAGELSDLVTARNIARDKANGRKPDVLVIGEEAVDVLNKKSTELRAYIGNDRQRAVIPKTEIIALLESLLDCEVIEVSGWYNSANPGQAASKARAWGDSAAFIYRGARAVGVDNGVVTNACTAMVFQEDLLNEMGNVATQAAGLTLAAYTWDEENPPHTAMAVGHSYDPVFVDNTLGYLMTDLV